MIFIHKGQVGKLYDGLRNDSYSLFPLTHDWQEFNNTHLLENERSLESYEIVSGDSIELKINGG